MTTLKKDVLRIGKPQGKVSSTASGKSWAGSDFARLNHSTTERISEALATASKKTGAFESHYAKK